MMKRYTLCLLLVSVLLLTTQTGLVTMPPEILSTGSPLIDDNVVLSADAGVPISTPPYIVLEASSGDVQARGNAWMQLLSSRGVPTELLQTSDVLSNPSLIADAPAILLDGSLGSSDGYFVSQDLVNLLIRHDKCVILTGHSAWLLHRLTDRGLPSLTAPVETTLYPQSDYAGAVFMSYPSLLVPGEVITSEGDLTIPVDITQTEFSHLANLTGSSSPSIIAPLRYDSWPLDVFLFTPENPDLLTSTGIDLLVNIIAFSTAIRETSTAINLESLQATQGRLLEGGMWYMHEATISSTYYAIHSVASILSGSAWTDWVTSNSAFVQSILTTLLVDYGSEIGFMQSPTEATVNCRTTGQALWIIGKMSLGGQFPTNEIATYLSSRQSLDGGFEDYVTTTYHVTEALWVTGLLTSININQLELWLRSLVIDGSKTSNPDLWGSIGASPTSISPLNNYATEYLWSLFYIGKAHPDPQKLTNWILSRTANGDGSFRNSLGLDEELVTGTASALTSMEIMGTLSASNKSLGLSWFNTNQLECGGFGLKDATSDLVGKVRETSRVALCLKALGETSGALAEGINSFTETIKTDTGFEGMDLLPSLMWTYWLLELGRLSHASVSVDLDLACDYISSYNKFTIYPFWTNLTTATAPEYSTSQYRTKSVWTQYFGVSAAKSVVLDLDTNVVSDVVLYLSQSQYPTGHYRPTSLMGTAHMQYSVAAIETLFLLDQLDTIPYRTNLEAAILSEYDGGSWSTLGWTLKPFAGLQEAIDYLSTRAAIRLGIITPMMASEITSTIEARIQYSDLLALSWDVATLSLLQTSSLSVDLESVNASLVLSALRSSHFTDGWFNETKLWQPVITTSILRMISILGLRCLIGEISGATLSANASATTQLGAMLDISVNISSNITVHSVAVNAFGETLLFNGVGNVDLLHFPVPTERQGLGLWNVTLMLMDWGSVRAFNLLLILVEGSLQGSLELITPTVRIGEIVNISLEWSFANGNDAGLSQVTIHLGDNPHYYHWSSDSFSPLFFSIPTTGFDAGIHQLTVTVEIPFCAPLEFIENVMIAEPNPTYLSAPASMDGIVGAELHIDWSLHFIQNNSIIEGQTVSLVIRDNMDSIVFTDVMLSSLNGNTFVWTPDVRGDYIFSLTFDGNATLDGSFVAGTVHVYETPQIDLSIPEDAIAPTAAKVLVSVTDSNSQSIQGVTVHVRITLNGAIMIDTDFMTNSTGHISISVNLNLPGLLQVESVIVPQGWLLGIIESSSSDVYSKSALQITIPGQPVEQGSTIGILITLTDYSGSPIIGAAIQINITWSNGTPIRTVTRITDGTGKCILAETFNQVGDFIIRAIYAGYDLNSSAMHFVAQRVFVTPVIELIHDPSSFAGEAMEITVNITDALGNAIAGRTIQMSITQDGSVVFETQFQSGTSPTIIIWYPGQGGLATITVAHPGNVYYLTTSTISTTSIMELVSGSLIVMPDQIDLFQSTTLVYILQSAVPMAGVTIHFEVLGMDLVPVWIYNALTNSSGIAVCTYMASEDHGVLYVTACPIAEEFLIGGDTQEQIIIMTFCNVTVSLQPAPPIVNTSTSITINAIDDLGGLIDGPTVTISLYNPYGEIVKLGSWTNSVTVPIISGVAVVDFVPTMVGLYTVVCVSSGSVSVHAFSSTTHHTIYSATELELIVSTYELEVGQTLDIVSRLLDHNRIPLVGRNIVLYLDGPGSSSFGPTTLVTNATGYVTWSVTINDEGFWVLEASFSGLGVYLPAEVDAEINVRYGTVIDLYLETLGDLIANQTEVSFSILLTDSGGTPLEGFTVQYQVYHETLGLVVLGSIIQTDTDATLLNLTLTRMGVYTIITSFSGTTHYHPSNAALEFIVLGITDAIVSIPDPIDRSSEEVILIEIEDETSQPIPLSELTITIALLGPNGSIDLNGRLLWNISHLELSIYGLVVGDYVLSVLVQPTDMRLGISVQFDFVITSGTSLSVSEENLPGIISEPHSIVFLLIDSLSESVDRAEVWVSLYDPLGREIYGHPLTTRSLLLSSITGTQISWTPILVGEYHLILVFEGDSYLNATSLELTVIVLHESSITMTVPPVSAFGEIIPVSITLEGALGGISGATISLVVMMNGEIEQELSLITGSRGVVTTNLVDLMAGSHSIIVVFAGSSTQATCSANLILDVTPVIVMNLEQIGNHYTGYNCSIELTVSILGASSVWNGSLVAMLFDPTHSSIGTWTFEVDSYSVLMMTFIPLSEGTYMLNVTINGLPILLEQRYPLTFAIVNESISLQLGAEAVPMFGGLGLLAIVGLVMRRKMRVIIGSIPGEWNE